MGNVGSRRTMASRIQASRRLGRDGVWVCLAAVGAVNRKDWMCEMNAPVQGACSRMSGQRCGRHLRDNGAARW